MAWRAADSLGIRSFLGLGLEEAAPDHSTISRTRRLIDVETHREIFAWILERLAAVGLVKGKTVSVDATTLEANAAMRSIVRRDTGESYQEFLTRLAKSSGIRTPSRAALARLDRRRLKKTSNTEWRSPSDPDAKITKMKDGRTHLAHKAEQAVDGRRNWKDDLEGQMAVYANRRRIRGAQGRRLHRLRGHARQPIDDSGLEGQRRYRLVRASVRAVQPSRSTPASAAVGDRRWCSALQRDVVFRRPAQAKEFYGKLFAWTFNPVKGSDLAAEIVVRGEAVGTRTPLPPVVSPTK